MEVSKNEEYSVEDWEGAESIVLIKSVNSSWITLAGPSCKIKSCGIVTTCLM